MGNEQQKIHSPHQETIFINHYKFRNVKVVIDGNQKLLKTTLGVYSQDYQTWINDLQQSCLDPHYILLPKRHEYEEKTICGYSGTLQLYFEDYRYVLSEQIHSRKEHNILFDETDLWYLLLVLSSAQQELRIKSNVKVGDIRPHNVFLNYEGQVKISCGFTWPRQQASFAQMQGIQRPYLSPEELVKMQRGLNLDPSSFQSEVFSIGLTMLSAGLLQDFLQFYHIQSKSCKFNTEKTNKFLDLWRNNKKYSQILTAVVSNLCQVKPENRIKDAELFSWISQFRADIVARNNFFIQKAPSHIEKQVAEIRKITSQNQQIFNHNLSSQQQLVDLNFDKYQYRPQNYQLNPHHNHSSSPINLRDHINPKYVQSYHQSVPSTQTAVSSFYSVPQIHKQTTKEQFVKFNIQPQNNNFHKRKGSQKIGVKQTNQSQFLIKPQLNLPDIQFTRMDLHERNLQNKGLSNLQNNFAINNIRHIPQSVQYARPALAVNNQFKNTSPQRLTFNNRVRSIDNGLSYFQNVIDPQGRRGGSIEQTVYIQRPDYLSKYCRQ